MDQKNKPLEIAEALLSRYVPSKEIRMNRKRTSIGSRMWGKVRKSTSKVDVTCKKNNKKKTRNSGLPTTNSSIHDSFYISPLREINAENILQEKRDVLAVMRYCADDMPVFEIVVGRRFFDRSTVGFSRQPSLRRQGEMQPRPSIPRSRHSRRSLRQTGAAALR